MNVILILIAVHVLISLVSFAAQAPFSFILPFHIITLITISKPLSKSMFHKYIFCHKYVEYRAMEIFYWFQHKYFSAESHYLSLAILLLVGTSQNNSLFVTNLQHIEHIRIGWIFIKHDMFFKSLEGVHCTMYTIHEICSLSLIQFCFFICPTLFILHRQIESYVPDLVGSCRWDQ